MLGPDGRFAANMKSMREARGWNQSELARRLTAVGVEGFHQTTISRIEAGSRPVRLGEAAAIARTLGTTVEMMVGHDGREVVVAAITEAMREAWARFGSLESAVTYFWDAQLSLRRTVGDPDPFDHERPHSPFRVTKEGGPEGIETEWEYVGWGEGSDVGPILRAALESLPNHVIGPLDVMLRMDPSSAVARVEGEWWPSAARR